MEAISLCDVCDVRVTLPGGVIPVIRVIYVIRVIHVIHVISVIRVIRVICDFLLISKVLVVLQILTGFSEMSESLQGLDLDLNFEAEEPKSRGGGGARGGSNIQGGVTPKGKGGGKASKESAPAKTFKCNTCKYVYLCYLFIDRS
jgi:hypothetical protein